MSIKWVRCLNHNPQHDTSQNPTDSPTSPAIVRVASLWPLATVAGAETHYMYIKAICYEYIKGVGLPHPHSSSNLEFPTTASGASLGLNISGWGIHMASSHRHSRRPGNLLNVYNINLLWVWSGWGASIITYSTLQVKPSDSPTPATVKPSRYQCGLWALWPQ